MSTSATLLNRGRFCHKKLMKFATKFLTLVSATFCIAVANAQPQLTVSPAVALSYPTELGKYYQLQVKKGTDWKNVGFATKGTGSPVGGLYPAGEYRVISPSREWVLVWADEFDGTDLDYSKWEKEENNYGGGNNERQAYRTDPKYCFVKDGMLKIAVDRDSHTTSDGKTQPYSSARIRTQKRAEWKYGRFEIRAKMPKGQGIWPAVWMLPTESKYGRWAAGGEIDIIESRGSAVHETTGALHFGGTWPRNTYLAHAYKFPKQDAAEAFHVYALEWNADEIKWYVDGTLCKTRKKTEWFSEAAKENSSAPFDQPFHMIVNVAVDGRFFEKTGQRADLLPPEAFPQILQIDYIRVYQWSE
ncbi:MAG: glycoside hydrolase family 16 protein [Zavarzinella sp.]